MLSDEISFIEECRKTAKAKSYHDFAKMEKPFRFHHFPAPQFNLV